MTKVQTPNNRKYYYYNKISDKIFSYEWIIPTTNLLISYSSNEFPNLLIASGLSTNLVVNITN